MNEVFTNAMNFKVTVNDAGVMFETPTEVVEFPYGSITGKLKVGFLTNINLESNGITRTFVAYGQDKARFKEAIAYADKMNRKAAPCEAKIRETVTIVNREHIKRCNVCGHVFCYTDNDVAENNKLAKRVEQNRKSAVMNAFVGTSIQSSLDTAEADRLAAQIRDFHKCPKCNAADLSDITKEEAAAASAPAPAAAPAASAAAQLKEFKELLDMGIITQEEFDAKKKQLLGL